MRPRITDADVDAMDGTQTVSELHDVFTSDFIEIRKAKRQIPDWLEDQDPDDYKERVQYHTYHEFMQSEMAAWLSNLDADTITATRVREKYTELRDEFKAEHPDISLDTVTQH